VAENAKGRAIVIKRKCGEGQNKKTANRRCFSISTPNKDMKSLALVKYTILAFKGQVQTYIQVPCGQSLIISALLPLCHPNYIFSAHVQKAPSDFPLFRSLLAQKFPIHAQLKIAKISLSNKGEPFTSTSSLIFAAILML
jgi:hypothetical protein